MDQPLLCLRCGYDLCETDEQSPCPECGLLARLSRVPEQLSGDRPRWLSGLHVGAWLVFVSLLLVLPVTLFAQWLYSEFYWSIRSSSLLVQGALYPLYILGWWLPLMGGLFLLTRKPASASWDSPSLRRSLRAWPLVSLALMSALGFFTVNRYRIESVTGVVAALALAVFPPLLFNWLRLLARRAPAPLLASDSPVIGTWMTVSILLPLGYVVIGELLDIDIGEQDFWLAILAVSASLFITCYLWSMYLLVRYAIAFRRAAADAKAAWRAMDRSLDPAGLEDSRR